MKEGYERDVLISQGGKAVNIIINKAVCSMIDRVVSFEWAVL